MTSMANCSRFSARWPMEGIVDGRLSIADRRFENAGAAIVGRGDQGARAIGFGSGKHGAGNLFRGTKGNGADGGTGAAQKSAERAGGFGGGDHFVEKRDELFAKGLMEAIDKSAAEGLVFTGGKSRGDGAGISGIFDGIEAGDPRRKKMAGLISRDLKIGN